MWHNWQKASAGVAAIGALALGSWPNRKETLIHAPSPPAVRECASSVGWYGTGGTRRQLGNAVGAVAVPCSSIAVAPGAELETGSLNC